MSSPNSEFSTGIDTAPCLLAAATLHLLLHPHLHRAHPLLCFRYYDLGSESPQGEVPVGGILSNLLVRNANPAEGWKVCAGLPEPAASGPGLFAGLDLTWFAQGPGHSCSGTVELASRWGVISDLSGSGKYLPNRVCRWHIAVPEAEGSAAVELTFGAIALGAGDTVSVYDGDTDSAPNLQRYSGTSAPGARHRSTTAKGLFVVFTSDGAGEDDGFSATFGSADVPLHDEIVYEFSPSLRCNATFAVNVAL